MDSFTSVFIGRSIAFGAPGIKQWALTCPTRGWRPLRYAVSKLRAGDGAGSPLTTNLTIGFSQEDIATLAELLRNSQTVALDHYPQAIPESKRGPQARVLDMIFGEDSSNGTFWQMAVSPH